MQITRRVLWFVLTFSMAGAAASASRSPQTAKDREKDDEAAIARLAIDWVLEERNNANAPPAASGPILLTRTAFVCGATPQPSDHPCLPSELVDGLHDGSRHSANYSFVPAAMRVEFLQRNAVPRPVSDPGRPGLVLVSAPDFFSMFAPPAGLRGWDTFHTRFPGVRGYIVFGTPAFDQERRQALLYSEYTYGLNGGVGQITLLARNETGWQITRVQAIWIA